MNLRTAVLLSGVVGGMSWLVRTVLDRVDVGVGLDPALHWVGLLLVATALCGYGAGLVSATWLRLVVGVAFPVLVWSVLEVFDPGTDPSLADGALGLVVAAVAVSQLARRHEPVVVHRHRGAHAR